MQSGHDSSDEDADDEDALSEDGSFASVDGLDGRYFHASAVLVLTDLRLR